jgi:hypothetical protein
MSDDVPELPEFEFKVVSPPGGAVTRQLRATWSIGNAADFLSDYMHCGELHGLAAYNYVPRIRWWQFWKWRLTFSDDYRLSRVGEIITTRQMAYLMKRAIDDRLRKAGAGLCQADGCEQPTKSSWDDRCPDHTPYTDGGRP